VTTHTVLHNLIFGCVLVFLIQWIFLGDLRSAIIVGSTFRLRCCLRSSCWCCGEDANLLSSAPSTFGIIVDSAVILVENIFRNFQEKRRAANAARTLAKATSARTRPARSTPVNRTTWTDAAAPDPISAHCRSTKRCCSPRRLRSPRSCRCSPCRGSRARSSAHGADLRLCAGGRADRHVHITPVLASILLARHVKEVETVVVRAMHCGSIRRCCLALDHRWIMVAIGIVFFWLPACWRRLGSEFLPALGGGQLLDPRIDADDHLPGPWDGEAATRKMREILLRHPEVITVVSQHGRPDNGSDASPFSNVELFVPLKPYDEWPAVSPRTSSPIRIAAGVQRRACRASISISRNTFRTTSRRRSPASKARTRSRSSGPIETLEKLGEPGQEQMRQVRGVADLGFSCPGSAESQHRSTGKRPPATA
jgi:heavy metal efflux system protein